MIDVSCDTRPWKDFSFFVAVEVHKTILYKDSEGAPEDEREDKVNKVLTGLHLVM